MLENMNILLENETERSLSCKLGKLYKDGAVIFSLPQAIENSRQF